MENILKYFKSSKQNFIMWSCAFLFVIISFVLSFFNLGNVVNTDGTESVLSGIDIVFGSHLNPFILIGWILLLLGLINSVVMVFWKKSEVLQSFLIIVPIFLFAFLPSIINAPLAENPEITKYISVEYTTELILIVVFLSMSAILYLSINLDQIRFTTREICELAMLVGLAVVLNFFPKIPLAWAGSINFQIVPLVIIALRFSPFKTCMASGLIFGLITCFTDGYGLFAFPLEYLVAFGSVAIISIFRKYILKIRTEKKGKSYTLAILLLMFLILIQTTIRFICASIDSYIFYYAYLDLDSASTAFGAALVYNAPYVYLTGLVTMGVVGALYYPILQINKKFSNK